MTLAIHPSAKLLPLMDAQRFAELVESIRDHGQQEEIVLLDGKILDGRNRYKACVKLGIAPKTREAAKDSNTYELSWILNGARRDLTDSQRYLFWKAKAERSEEWQAKHADIAKVGAEKRVSARRKQPRAAGGTFSTVGGSSGPTNGAKVHVARDAKADASKTSPSTVKRMDTLSVNRPDLAAKVLAGTMKASQAMREMKREEVVAKTRALPKGKYRVIYADPPWKYGNDGAISDADNYSRTGKHYPPMPLAEICALPVKKLAAKDSVLFLWVTSPMLEAAFEVISAWSFKYKSSFVWDKVKHNYAHYNSMRHEFLLIATRGAATPDSPKLHDSVVSIERGAHSEKPERFRELIDEMYPNGPRIELFARRSPADGWEVWGNEA